MSNIKIIPIRTPLQVVYMCKASLVIIIDDEKYLITRRVFNEIQSGKYTESVLVVEKPDKIGNLLKWLAIPTIF
jgi:hypothetical protein